MESLQPPPSSPVTFSSNSNALVDSGERNWLDLPLDAVLCIFVKLNTIDLLIGAHNVCTIWRTISKDPTLYRTIDMSNSNDRGTRSELEILCLRALDYSCGLATDINIEYFGTHYLLCHIANFARRLRCLRLACCDSLTDLGWSVLPAKLSHLEELDVSICGGLSHISLEAIGPCCPRLKTFKFNTRAYKHRHVLNDKEAFAIANSMPWLCHLELIGNKMTNQGLLAILDGCPYLESLDIRQCFNINFVGSLRGRSLMKRCKEQIKYLRHTKILHLGS